MDLFHRTALALYDFRGDDSRQRENQLLSTFDRKNAAGDVVQIQICLQGFDAWLETGGQYRRRLALYQAKSRCSAREKKERSAITRYTSPSTKSMLFSYRRD